MKNYQLYRTNVLLGGQMKWDLILNSNFNELYVDDFHLTPISDNVPYNKYAQDDLLNYNHLENIKSFYKKTQGSFYENYINSKFSHDWPIISKENEVVKNYDDTFNMGCKRIENFSIYNRQFEFFCPVWLEQLSNDDKLIFIFNIKDENGKKISSKSLTLKPLNNSYHDKFINYFNNYLKDLNIDTGNDDILNINFKNNIAYLSGIDVLTGQLANREIKSITNNLLSRERPLMESDNFLISPFKDTHTITKQLFNFNLCFNFNDIAAPYIANIFYGKKIIIELRVGTINNKHEIKLFDLVDFYSNYEYIPKIKDDIIRYNNNNPNVLSYLLDDKYIELINKNKFTQNIIHWSLADNNNYIFNVYEGFSGFGEEPTENENKFNIIKYSHQYANSPDLTQTKYSKSLNNINWADNVSIKSAVQLTKLLLNPVAVYNSVHSDFNNNWVHNIKYKITKKLKVLLLQSTNHLFISFSKYFKQIDDQELYYYIYNSDGVKLIVLGAENPNFLTFASVKKILNDNKLLDDTLNELKQIMKNVIQPSTIIFNKTLIPILEKSPDLSSKEIFYHKNDNTYEYITRYDGKIKPTFVGDEFNNIYYKQSMTENDLKSSPYISSGFLPLYPSIGYCAIKSTQCNYSKKLPEELNSSFEYKWFNNGKCIPLKNELTFERKFEAGQLKTTNLSTKVSLEQFVKEFITEYYKITNKKLINYIYDRYFIENDYKCFYNNESKLYYIYNVKLKLK